MFYASELRADLGVVPKRQIMPSTEVSGRFNVDPVACPFCFSQSIGIFMETRNPYCICMWCGAEGPKAHERFLEGAYEAVLKWNNRVRPEVPTYIPSVATGRKIK